MQYTSINKRVEEIKDNQKEINSLVEEYKPFIASCTEKAVGRYVRYGEDDELSIAMIAFVESIKAYNINKGNFLSFAQSVIKRRLIDYYRKEKKNSKVVSINEFRTEDEENIDLTEREAVDKYLIDEESEYRKLELDQFKKELQIFDISFNDLVESSPKHKKTRNICSGIIKYIMACPDIAITIKKKMYLPINEIEKGTKIPRKKFERMRKYIIAVVIIITGDYQHIRDYVDWGEDL